jgi:hypothetical protein
MGKRSNDIGKAFEADVQTQLEVLQRTELLRYIRLYDTHAANAYLPESPADFIVGTPLGGILLECKASEEHQSLALCLGTVKTHQAAAARLWVRTGNPSLFLFYSWQVDVVEAWEGSMVGECRATKKKLPKDGALFTVPSYELNALLRKVLLEDSA